MKHGYYITTEENLETEELAQRLYAAGIETQDSRATTLNHDGVIMTLTLATGIWNAESGYDICYSSCADRAQKHVPYEDLSQEQRETFAKSVATHMSRQRAETYEMAETLQGHRSFQNIAMKPCEE